MLRRLAAATAAVALMTTPAIAADGDCELIRGVETADTSDDVQVCEQQNWLHDSGGRVANVSDIPTFDTNEPTASVADNAGGASLGLAAGAQNLGRHTSDYDLVFAGEFTGNIDAIATELYLFTTARAGAPNQAVSIQLTIDGQILYQTGSEADRTPLSAGGDAVSITELGFTDVYAAMENRGLELGDDVTHTVEISVSQWFSVNDNVAYVYDTVEAPSSITFNPDRVRGLKIDL